MEKNGCIDFYSVRFSQDDHYPCKGTSALLRLLSTKLLLFSVGTIQCKIYCAKFVIGDIV